MTAAEMKLLDLLRNISDEFSPGIYNLKLKGLNADSNGLYKAEDVMDRFDKAIGAYDSLIEEYEAKDAA